MRVFGNTILLDKTERVAFLRENYPGIVRAALAMSYANGGINRDRTEEQMLVNLWDVMVAMQQQGASDLPEVDKWLGGLSYADLDTAVDGEETDMRAVLVNAPEHTDLFLEAVFETTA